MRLTEQLRALVEAVGADADLSGELWHLLTLAAAAVPSCLGLSLVFGPPDPPLTLSALVPPATAGPVLASLVVHLPRRSTADAGTQLVLYSGAVGAFDDVAPDLLALLDLSSRHLTRDAHLALPDSSRSALVLRDELDDRSAVARAIGMLLDRGLLPDAGYRELLRRGTERGGDAAAAARTLLAEAAGSDASRDE